jgi:hypothetical protein
MENVLTVLDIADDEIGPWYQVMINGNMGSLSWVREKVIHSHKGVVIRAIGWN